MPRRLATPLDDDAVAMGIRLRERRTELGLTLKEVAAASGLSHAFVSLVERGRSRPSLPSFARLAAALQSTPVDLLADLRERPDATAAGGVERLVRRAEAAPASYAGAAGRVVHADPDRLRVMEIRNEGHNPDEELLFHVDHDEVLYVLEGRVEVRVDGEVVVLDVGDAIHYPPGTAHTWSSHGPGPSRILLMHY